MLTATVSALVALAAMPSQTSAPRLFEAMKGPWLGYLEYEVRGVGGRERVATMLRVTPGADGRSATLRFAFDEGPEKVFEDTQKVTLDAEMRTYAADSNGKITTYRVENLDRLKADGTGELLLLGSGTESDKPVEVRLTLTLDGAKASMLRETRAGDKPFAFRSVYRFTKLAAM